LGKDQFIDRSYGEDVRIKRDGSGKPIVLVYDRFKEERPVQSTVHFLRHCRLLFHSEIMEEHP
jgi:hypothetical protein